MDFNAHLSVDISDSASRKRSSPEGEDPDNNRGHPYGQLSASISNVSSQDATSSQAKEFSSSSQAKELIPLSASQVETSPAIMAAETDFMDERYCYSSSSFSSSSSSRKKLKPNLKEQQLLRFDLEPNEGDQDLEFNDKDKLDLDIEGEKEGLIMRERLTCILCDRTTLEPMGFFKVDDGTPFCQHTFCRECMDRHIESIDEINSEKNTQKDLFCPYCCKDLGELYAPEMNVKLIECAKNYKMKCPAYMHCRRTGAYDEIQAHFDACEYITSGCSFSNMGCKWKGFRKEAYAHQKSCYYNKLSDFSRITTKKMSSVEKNVRDIASKLSNMDQMIRYLTSRVGHDNKDVVKIKANIRTNNIAAMEWVRNYYGSGKEEMMQLAVDDKPDLLNWLNESDKTKISIRRLNGQCMTGLLWRDESMSKVIRYMCEVEGKPISLFVDGYQSDGGTLVKYSDTLNGLGISVEPNQFTFFVESLCDESIFLQFNYFSFS